MAKSVLHVVPHNQEWAVKREGNERASSTHLTQKEAIEAARELAKELDDIVIHRPDGTIRERVTYFGTTAGAAETKPAATEPEVGVEDVAGVGSRVSWEAVLAGALTAVAAYITLSLFALALGLSLTDQTWGRGFTVTAVVTSTVILLLSLFLGGYVASCTTAGEQPREAGVYGVLVWGVVFTLLITGGVGFGLGHLSGMKRLGAPADTALSAERVKTELGLTEQQVQHYRELAQAPAAPIDPTAAAWWAFGGVALSLLAAVAGSMIGVGPELVPRVARDPRAAVVAPQTA